MKRSSGARLCATAAVGALSLVLVTGCSDEGSKKDSEGSSKGSGSSSSSAPAAKALTAAELEKLLLAQGEVKGYKVDAEDATLPKSKSAVKVDKAACEPLVYAVSALPPGDTDASARNTVTEDKSALAETKSPEDISESDIEDAFDLTSTLVGLSSYEGDGAEKTMKAVTDSVAACSGGFSMTSGSETQKATKVTSAKASGLGEESVAFTVVADMDGEGTADFQVEVVRSGGTVATFYGINFGALAKGGESKVPAAVLQAQVAKLK
ncbi:hypothetical protein ACIRPQ_32250 [Streptomyces sp. NPDC101213]|uniref:hypothetical protein n=1 Tax=Streptomyces sp. NPDC101213 TaxID=3366130 RepID=UPI003828EEB6